jgi:hypothetical protein
LKPRRTEVRALPSLPFVYFNPYLLTASKGFQVLYTDPIPLQVLPHEKVQLPIQAPEQVFVLAMGPGVLDRQTPWTPPQLGAILGLLLMPPVACVAWYLVWRRIYPDTARMASQQRSGAARRALQAIHALRRLDAQTRAARTTAIVAGYLQQRLDLTIAEPTPHEVALLLSQHDYSPALTERAAQFFDTCDRARFLPADDVTSGSDLSPVELHDSAIQLILAVEEETCPTPHS